MKRYESDFTDRYLFHEADLETITLRRTEPSEKVFERNFRDLKGLDSCTLKIVSDRGGAYMLVFIVLSLILSANNHCHTCDYRVQIGAETQPLIDCTICIRNGS